LQLSTQGAKLTIDQFAEHCDPVLDVARVQAAPAKS
jgi:hypothetical protein